MSALCRSSARLNAVRRYVIDRLPEELPQQLQHSTALPAHQYWRLGA
jgi:hypothetical protein